MGRPVNKKCQHCASLAVDEAATLHGPQGDGCWNPGDRLNQGYDCHRRRNHYRHRQDANQTRRRLRKLGKTAGLGVSDSTEYAEVNPPTPPMAIAAVLVLYRQRADTPVHAVAAEIWQGDRKIAGIRPAHCLGLRGNQVSQYIQEILTLLNQQFGIGRFEDVIKEVPVEHCPIHPCPLKRQ